MSSPSSISTQELKHCYSCDRTLDYQCNMCGRRVCDGCVSDCYTCKGKICEDHMFDQVMCKQCKYEELGILERESK